LKMPSNTINKKHIVYSPKLTRRSFLLTACVVLWILFVNFRLPMSTNITYQLKFKTEPSPTALLKLNKKQTLLAENAWPQNAIWQTATFDHIDECRGKVYVFAWAICRLFCYFQSFINETNEVFIWDSSSLRKYELFVITAIIFFFILK